MFAILHALGMLVADLFKSRSRLEAENLFLRHQLAIALRRAPPRLRLRGSDRALLIWMTRLWPDLVDAVQVVQPETILRWHRAGFKVFWRWKSRNRAGRPKIDRGLRDLIRRMSRENALWGASRIHGELLMLGFQVAQSTVSKYMVRCQNPPSQTWKTFLQNHAEAIAAIDLSIVPTLTFDLLFALLVVGHGRRQLLWFEVTRHIRRLNGWPGKSPRLSLGHQRTRWPHSRGVRLSGAGGSDRRLPKCPSITTSSPDDCLPRFFMWSLLPVFVSEKLKKVSVLDFAIPAVAGINRHWDYLPRARSG